MPNLETDLSVSPYFNDYDNTKNFYQILYKPAVAVQTREVNQMQTILQDQIDKFGRSIYKDGSVIEGCTFTYDNAYAYVKIKDTFSNNFTISNVSDFENQYVLNSNGLKAVIVNSAQGYESQNPDLNTLFIKYLNSATFSNGAVQQTFANTDNLSVVTSANVLIGNVTVATVTNSTGYGYAFTTTEGVIFKKGFFLRVPQQTLVVSKYTNVPDGVSVGFDAIEDIITADIDSTLFDNAAGAPNYRAPGANRLRIIPTLAVKPTPVSNSSTVDTVSFFSVCDFKQGYPVSIKQDPQYSVLGKELARRTFETNGDFVVKPFVIDVQTKYDAANTANTTYSMIACQPGVGYVQGYRVEYINTNYVPIRKGTDKQSVFKQSISTPFGNYLYVTEFCGDFRPDIMQKVELHNIAYQAITQRTFLATSYSTAYNIGYAYVRSVVYYSGTPGVDATYKVYLSDVTMNPGQRFSSVQSIAYYSGSLKAVADAVLQPTFRGSTSNVAVLQSTDSEIMVQTLGQKSISSDGFNNISFVYRSKASASFSSGSSTLSVTIPSAYGTGSEALNYQGNLPTNLELTYITIPTVNGYSNNLSGTVTTTSSSNSVTGTSTAFLSEVSVGDYIYVGGTDFKRVVSIISDTSLTVDANFGNNKTANTYQLFYPAGVPINFIPTKKSVNTTSSSTFNINLGRNANANFGVSVYFDVLRSSTVPVKKQLKQSYVKIDMSNNIANSSGPWCLGLPDVIGIASIYVGNNGTYSTTGTNVAGAFRYISGQADSYYGLGYLYRDKFIPTPNTTLLCLVNHFDYVTSQGVGFFNANSYPVDDANTANTNAIRTQQIPRYTSSSGDVYDLRDCIDYRAYVTNTAVSNTPDPTYATINPSVNLTFATTNSLTYVPTPDNIFQTDVGFYLGRIDRVGITTSGNLFVKEGIPSTIPSVATEDSGTSTLAIVNVPPYPSLSSTEAKAYGRYDYAYQINMQQIKRYTMSDIKKLDNRIKNLEYYTSLSLIEQATSSLQVRSDATGLNRFKNGILVDPFVDHSIGNTLDKDYAIAIDSAKTEIRPQFATFSMDLSYNSSLSSGVVQTGNMVGLNYSNTLYQSQVYASKYRNCIDGNIFNYKGTLYLDPPGTINSDLTYNPVVLGNLNDSANWVNMQKNHPTAYNSQWGNWVDTTPTQNISTNLNNSVNDINSRNIAPINNNTAAVTQQLINQTNPGTSESGQFVTNVSIMPFVKSRYVYFAAKGMKPNTPVYPFFNNVNVSKLCIPLIPYTGVITTVNNMAYNSDGTLPVTTDSKGNSFTYVVNNWGSQLKTDQYGSVYGVFLIPEATFKAGELEFKLTDISNLAQGISAVTTQASAIYFATPLSVTSARPQFQIVNNITNVTDITNNVTNISNINNTTINNSTTNVTNVTNNTNVTNLVVSVPTSNDNTPIPFIPAPGITSTSDPNYTPNNNLPQTSSSPYVSADYPSDNYYPDYTPVVVNYDAGSDHDGPSGGEGGDSSGGDAAGGDGGGGDG